MSNLIKKGVDYLTKFPRVYKSLKTNGTIPPKQVTLELTNRCNARCVFCNRWKVNPTEIKKELKTEEWLRIIKELAEVKTQYIDLSGGEPLLKEGFFEIVNEIKKHNIEIVLSENGLLLPKYAKKIIESNIDYVRVSIDSHIPENHDKTRGVKGMWKNAIKGVKLLKKAGMDVAINFVLMKNNIEELSEYIKFAKDLGVDFDVQPVHDDSLTNDLFARDKRVLFSKSDINQLNLTYNKIIKSKGFNWIDRIYYNLTPTFLIQPERFTSIKCPVAGRVVYFIDPYGKVYPCESRRDLVLGNVKEERFVDIISSKKANNIRKLLYSTKRNCVCWYRCTAPSMIQYQFPPHIPIPKFGNPILIYKWNKLIRKLRNRD